MVASAMTGWGIKVSGEVPHGPAQKFTSTVTVYRPQAGEERWGRHRHQSRGFGRGDRDGRWLRHKRRRLVAWIRRSRRRPPCAPGRQRYPGPRTEVAPETHELRARHRVD